MLFKKGKEMKFRDELITNLLNNEGGKIGKFFREIELSRNGEICLAQGYGLNQNVPIRLLAYPIPVMRLWTQLGNPVVNLYIAKHGVERANSQNYQNSCDLVKKVLEKYVKTFYQTEIEVLIDSDLSPALINVIENLMPSALEIYQSDEQIRAFADKRGGMNAIRYMVEHIFYMRDSIDIPNMRECLLVKEMSLNHQHIIMIGGPAEKIFYRFRQQIIERVGFHEQWKSTQLFTQIGDPPTYHCYENEPVFGCVLPDDVDGLFRLLNSLPDSNQGKIKNILRDYKILLQEFARVEKFSLPHEVAKEVLEKGYERLKHFISEL